MPWDTKDYPDAMKNLKNVVRKKAIDIANALLDNDYPEDRAIPIAISQAEEWYEKSDQDEIKAFDSEQKPKKDDDHEHTGNADLLDNDVLVYFEENEWKVRTKKAKRPDSTFETKKDATNRAKEIAENKESNVISYTKDGKKQV
ncbi:DUF2188 domain-containing protein [Marinilactibacillus sp. Marseille-P9653]|uniref:DUF2188 domain-containing protein n=1 Tax=Marinilactibacillus sp. Marseille-P9653 TaxID=2866583 RepID=UPI001CE49C66|nr:DUF2188 domain-containing protein [Marinilactibacillus sp. Marseille-P9653]